MTFAHAAAAALLAVLACTTPKSGPSPGPSAEQRAAQARPPETGAGGEDAGTEAGPEAGGALDAAAVVDPAAAERALYPKGGAPAACKHDTRCLIGRLYLPHPKARAVALDLYGVTGDVAGLEEEQWMDGGFRGRIHLVPELPVDKYRQQLEWVRAAAADFNAFYADLYGASPPPYRWRGLTFRFLRSVGRTTPSAYARGPRPAGSAVIGWSLGYNVAGSLLRSEKGVRETLFHEIFHMNDDAHGDWSYRALSADYDAIVKKCGRMNVACLAPYAPNDTRVRGGTYYAFQGNNGAPVREYAAELALRWYKEERAVLHHERLPGGRPFKCGPPENGRAWKALLAEFFAGKDTTPACPAPK